MVTSTSLSYIGNGILFFFLQHIYNLLADLI